MPDLFRQTHCIEPGSPAASKGSGHIDEKESLLGFLDTGYWLLVWRDIRLLLKLEAEASGWELQALGPAIAREPSGQWYVGAFLPNSSTGQSGLKAEPLVTLRQPSRKAFIWAVGDARFLLSSIHSEANVRLPPKPDIRTAVFKPSRLDE